MDEISRIYKYLPHHIAPAVSALPPKIKDAATEIRLRADAPLSVTAGDMNLFFDKNGNVCNRENALVATKNDISESISLMTGNSLYSYEEYLKNGFIPLKEGFRAGICGDANTQGGKVKNFSEIKYINIRIKRFIKDFAAELIKDYAKNGLRGALVISPPGMGKTTFLRSAIYLISNGIGIRPRRLGVADERLELTSGVPLGTADVITSAPKAESVSLLTRTMSPEIIVCDEISGTEAQAVAEAMSGGVCFIASAHGNDIKRLYASESHKKLFRSGAFPLCVSLYYENGYKYDIFETEGSL